jgi:hypothetical protein
MYPDTARQSIRGPARIHMLVSKLAAREKGKGKQTKKSRNSSKLQSRRILAGPIQALPLPIHDMSYQISP